MSNVKKAISRLRKKAPLGVKGAENFDWVNHDQIYNDVFEEWPSMRHNAILDGGGSCERSYFIEGGLRFASSFLIKGRGWHHYMVVDDMIFFCCSLCSIISLFSDSLSGCLWMFGNFQSVTSIPLVYCLC